jgi:hypothetical protein
MAGNGEALPPNFMPWESSDGTTHYTPSPGYTYDASSPMPVVVTPPNGISQPCDPNHGVTVTMCNNGQQGEIHSRGQHTVHFHVHQGEAVSLQLGEQVENFILAFPILIPFSFVLFFVFLKRSNVAKAVLQTVLSFIKFGFLPSSKVFEMLPFLNGFG